MEKMTVNLNGKNYEVWAADAVNDCNDRTYSANVYNNEKRDLRVGVITWETVEGWSEHRFNQETGRCAVEGCDGSCENESNACDWEKSSFEIVEYANMTEDEIITHMKEVK